MAGRIGRGWGIAKQSWSIIRKNPALLPFPLFSAVAFIFVLGSFIAPLFFIPGLGTWLETLAKAPKDDPIRQQAQVIGAAVVFSFYVVSYFVILFCNTALAAAAAASFRGETPSIGGGLRVAVSRLPQLIAWTLVSATVGTILQLIRERSNFLGKVVVGIIGAGWSVATYLVVPVLAVEGLGPIASLKRSASLISESWGEGLAGNVGLGIFSFLMFLPAVPLGILGILLLDGTPMIAAGVFGFIGLYLVAACILSSAMKQVFVVGLYYYAAENRVPVGFSEESFKGAFKKK